MPYAMNADLPPAVREKYSDRCMTVFRHTFNATAGDETLKFKFAHTAAMNCMQATGKDERSPLVDMTVKFTEGSDTFIEGLGVPFGIDLDGESFSAKTDLCPDWFPNGGRPILYHHGFDSSVKFEAIGHEIESTMTDDGLWVRAELDKASKYYAKVKKLVAQGAVGWSSGAPDHKVKMGQGGVYDRWPPVEFSLTPTPAFPNRVAYSMKSAEAIKHLEAVDADIPEPLSAAAIEQAHEGDSEPEPLADHSQRVLAEVKAWVERVSEKSDFRAKSGRELSKRNIEALRETHRIIGELLARADAPSEDEQRTERAKTQKAEYLCLQAESLTG